MQRKRFQEANDLIETAWVEFKGMDFEEEFWTIRDWVNSRVAPSTQLNLATGWLVGKLLAHERELTLQAEREASRLRQEKIDRHNNDPEVIKKREEEEQRFIEWQRKNEAERSARLLEYQRHMVEEIKKEAIIEWTDKLLSQPIRMPDGTRTTWGEATVEQHRQRLEMFEKNAIANTEGAVRHALALEKLHVAGVTCLNEITKEKK